MSYLDHECRACGHQAMAHAGQSCTNAGCRCKARPEDFSADPRIYQTWDSVTGKKVEALTAPGEPVFYGNNLTCACPACEQAYKAVT